MNELEKRQATLVAALRSGEYTQTQSRLRVDDSFCCLGVACDIYAKETGLGEWKQTGSSWSFSVNGRYGIDALLPSEVADYFGFEDTRGLFTSSINAKDSLGNDVRSDGARDSLARLNDFGASFIQIADIIESKPKQLFYTEETQNAFS